MKKATLLIFALFPLLLFGKTFNSEAGLELSFRLFDKGIPMKEYSMIVFKDGRKLDSFLVKKDREVYLLLELNSSYTISISKSHFRERMIMAETKVPEGKEDGEYNYSFDVNMISDTAKSPDDSDIPVMMIHYDGVSGSFFLSQPEGITVVSDDDVIVDESTDPPKPAESTVPAKKKGLRSIAIRKR